MPARHDKKHYYNVQEAGNKYYNCPRGFPLTLWADTQTQKFQVTMKHSLSHTIELGSDPVGNMARLDHALNIMVENLEENRGLAEKPRKLRHPRRGINVVNRKQYGKAGHHHFFRRQPAN